MGPPDFRALVENAPDAIVLSREGIVLYANQAAATLLGYDDVSDIVGKPMTFLDPRSAAIMRRRIEQMSAGEKLGRGAVTARRSRPKLHRRSSTSGESRPCSPTAAT